MRAAAMTATSDGSALLVVAVFGLIVGVGFKRGENFDERHRIEFVSGDCLVIADKLEIGCTAVIRGNVTARSIAIAQGAIVEGDIAVTSGAPIVHFQEKREAR